MIRRRVSDIVERFARDPGYMLVANFESVRGYDTEREALRRPPENSLPNLTPVSTNGNFSNNCSDSAAVGILKHDMNIAVYLDC